MAETTQEAAVTWNDPERIAFQLGLIQEEVSSLPAVFEWWQDAPETAKGTFELEWMDTMTRLGILRNSAEAGFLSPQQSERLERIYVRLGECASLLEGMSLAISQL